jgi:hypothetical protein
VRWDVCTFGNKSSSACSSSTLALPLRQQLHLWNIIIIIIIIINPINRQNIHHRLHSLTFSPMSRRRQQQFFPLFAAGEAPKHSAPAL